MTEKEPAPYKVLLISSWEDYVAKVSSPPYNSWAFRGHADSTWPLASTLSRYLNAYVDERFWESQEARSLRIFQRKAHLFLTHIPATTDTFEWLALMQHHGAPTRLLDFTWSPYVAAFFALERAAPKAAVWGLNPKKLTNVTEKLGEFLQDVRGGPIGIGEPFVLNQRLISQSGTFIVTREAGTPIEDLVAKCEGPEDTLVKFELPADLVRSTGMLELFRMNITNATLFPGIDGLARSLAYELEFHWSHNPRKGSTPAGSQQLS
jgi:FRG domain